MNKITTENTIEPESQQMRPLYHLLHLALFKLQSVALIVLLQQLFRNGSSKLSIDDLHISYYPLQLTDTKSAEVIGAAKHFRFISQ